MSWTVKTDLSQHQRWCYISIQPSPSYFGRHDLSQIDAHSSWRFVTSCLTSDSRRREPGHEWKKRRDDVYKHAVELFSRPDEEVQYQMLQIATPANLANVNPAKVAYVNMKIYKMVDSIKLDEIDEKYLLLMLSHVSKCARKVDWRYP